MAFIDPSELKIRKFQSLIDDIAEDNVDSVLEEVELMAVAEVKGYMSAKYDVAAIFTATGTDRDPQIRRIVMDYMLCFLWERTNSNEIPDSLRERCASNTEYLQGVASGANIPGGGTLPIQEDPTLVVSFQSGSETVFNNTDNID